MLKHEIESAEKLVKTDSYPMSIGEIINMYKEGDLIIEPEFQRLFRWNDTQKSKLIESILLGIPIPAIFLFERQDGKWELIDGLQRISTVLEFMGLLKDHEGNLLPPSILQGTSYLPSLSNCVWEKSDQIETIQNNDQCPLDKPYQLYIKRARISLQILKRPSEPQTKFELFQRLNAGGTIANAQELRNCMMIMTNRDFFQNVSNVAGDKTFNDLMNITKPMVEKQKHLELATRFIVHTNVNYKAKLDVEEYFDFGVNKMAQLGDGLTEANLLSQTFQLLNKCYGKNTLRRYSGGRHTGKVGLVGFEVIAIGVAKNIVAILKQNDPEKFIKDKIKKFWKSPSANDFTAAGLNGSRRIQQTVPYGISWFKP